MIVFVYSHERELQSQIHVLKRAGVLESGTHVALRLSKSPGRSQSGTIRVEGLLFFSWEVCLTSSTAIDISAHASSRRLIKRLKRRLPKIHSMVVGDVAGPKAVIARAGQKAGLRLILFPEGIGIFRAEYGGYPWRETGWRSSLGSRALAAKTIWGEQGKGKLSIISMAYWHIFSTLKLAFDSLTVRPESAPHQLDEVDLLLTSWGPGAQIPVRAKSRIDLPAPPGDKDVPQRILPRTAMFLQTPESVTTEVWLEALEFLVPRVARVIVRWHRVDNGRDELLDAMAQLGLGIEIDSHAGPLETRKFDEIPQFFLGTYSTALLDCVSRFPEAEILCLADSLARVAERLGEEVPDYLNSHQVKALRNHSSGQIRFV